MISVAQYGLAVADIHDDGRVAGPLGRPSRLADDEIQAIVADAAANPAASVGRVAIGPQVYVWSRPLPVPGPARAPYPHRYRGYTIRAGTYYQAFRELFARKGDTLIGPTRGLENIKWDIDRAIDGPTDAPLPAGYLD